MALPGQEQSDFVVFLCPVCGRILKWPRVSTAAPNTICGPHYDEGGKEYMCCMVPIWPQKGGLEIQLPTLRKCEWIVKNLSKENLKEMAADLLYAGVKACKTGDLKALAQLITEWEAIAEI